MYMYVYRCTDRSFFEASLARSHLCDISVLFLDSRQIHYVRVAVGIQQHIWQDFFQFLSHFSFHFYFQSQADAKAYTHILLLI